MTDRMPAEKYSHVPDPARHWLEGLTRDDIEEFEEAIRFVRDAKASGSWQWLKDLRAIDIQELEDTRRFIRGVKAAGSVWKYGVLAFLGFLIMFGGALQAVERVITRFWPTPPTGGQ